MGKFSKITSQNTKLNPVVCKERENYMLNLD